MPTQITTENRKLINHPIVIYYFFTKIKKKMKEWKGNFAI